ncbi:hypothetical protein, partial [Nocardia farcinica]|uniref:hypothetical protein n=1 Tax=Nocardia farcinica TaxID=37329 RepID=UPI0024576E26
MRELVEGIAGAEPVVLASGHAPADERSVGWTAVTEFLARTSRGGGRGGAHPPPPPPPPEGRGEGGGAGRGGGQVQGGG